MSLTFAAAEDLATMNVGAPAVKLTTPWFGEFG